MSRDALRAEIRYDPLVAHSAMALIAFALDCQRCPEETWCSHIIHYLYLDNMP